MPSSTLPAALSGAWRREVPGLATAVQGMMARGFCGGAGRDPGAPGSSAWRWRALWDEKAPVPSLDEVVADRYDEGMHQTISIVSESLSFLS